MEKHVVEIAIFLILYLLVIGMVSAVVHETFLSRLSSEERELVNEASFRELLYIYFLLFMAALALGSFFYHGFNRQVMLILLVCVLSISASYRFIRLWYRRKAVMSTSSPLKKYFMIKLAQDAISFVLVLSFMIFGAVRA